MTNFKSKILSGIPKVINQFKTCKFHQSNLSFLSFSNLKIRSVCWNAVRLFPPCSNRKIYLSFLNFTINFKCKNLICPIFLGLINMKSTSSINNLSTLKIQIKNIVSQAQEFMYYPIERFIQPNLCFSLSLKTQKPKADQHQINNSKTPTTKFYSFNL